MTTRMIRRRRWLGVGALVCGGFLLQQLVVPLHLILNDHHVAGGAHAHGEHGHLAAHANGAHAHDHARPHLHAHLAHEGADRVGAAGRHAPHSIEDHLDQLPDPVVLPHGPRPVSAPALAWTSPVPPARPLLGRLVLPERSPRAPPPRRSAPTRAPPVTV